MRKIVAWDTETCLIRPAQLAPALVCLTWQTPGAQPQIVHARDAEPIFRSWLEDPDVLLVGHHVCYDAAVMGEAFPHLRDLIFAAYGADRITCTKLREQLLDIAAGTFRRQHIGRGQFVKRLYDLQAVAKRKAGIELQKDFLRLSYGEFLDVPLEAWPRRAVEVQARARVRLAELEAAVAERRLDGKDAAVKKELEGLRDMIEGAPERVLTYALDDARATLAVYLAQEQHAAWLDDQYRKARAYFALYLSSAWGLRTDEHGVEVLRRETTAELEELEEELVQLGLVRANGSKDTKAAKRRMLDVCRRDELVIPRTATHGEPGKCKKLDGTPLPDGSDECEEHVGLDADACDASEDDVLIGYSNYATQKKVLSNDVKVLLKGIQWPLHTSYGLAETGRTTSSKPPIQNVTKRPGMRECYVARPGYVFAQADFPTLELYTLAQCCVKLFGYSKLADALNAGLDPHLWFAASMLGITYERAAENKKRPDVKRARQLAKPADFGFPGGMGPRKFVSATRKGVIAAAKAEGIDPRQAWAELDLHEDLPADYQGTGKSAKKLRDEWFVAFPEMQLYFGRAEQAAGEDGRGSVVSLFTNRHRGQATYCARCNTPFQGLAADCATEAMWLVAHAQYVERASPLFNSRTVAFVHDELIAEVPDDERADPAARELARLMVVAANTYLPDVPIPLSKMEPLLMRRWSKNASPTFGADGRLVPCR